MKTLLSSVLVFIILLSSFPSILAIPNSNPIRNNIRIPEHAIQIAENVFSLGSTKVDGKIVQGFLFVRYQEGFAKPSGTPGKGNDKNKDTSDFQFYELMGKGVSWKTKEDYIYDSVTIDVTSKATIETSFATWEFLGFDIFGTGAQGTIDGLDYQAPDTKNEIFFDNIEDAGVIAMCIVWGVFGGPPPFRELVEFDIVFDNTEYSWGDATLNPVVMDLENIATHEIGHALGLADLYLSMYDTTDPEVLNTVTEQTMYGYADFGEYNKRTLESGDIAGVNALYG